MGDKKVESKPNWFSKNFNSTTIRGRANVAKATYGFIAVSYIVYKFTRKKGGGGSGKIEEKTHEDKTHQHHDNYEHGEHHHEGHGHHELSEQERDHGQEEDRHGKHDASCIQSSLPVEDIESKIEDVNFVKDKTPTKGFEFKSFDEIDFVCNCGV